MNHRLLSCTLVSLSMITVANAQQNTHLPFCVSDEVNNSFYAKHPTLKSDVATMNLNAQKFLSANNKTAQKVIVSNGDTVYQIPIVVHIITTGGSIGSQYNPADATINTWIDYLNQTYAATWASYPSVSEGGAKFKIQYKLATRDENCNSTTGINRVDGSSISGYSANGLNYSNSNGASQNQIKSIARWNPDAFYNIYVINKIDGEDGFNATTSFVAGFAYYAGVPSDYDGAFMLVHTAEPDNIVLPHELGHSNGLKHIFQGADSYGNSCPSVSGNCDTSGDDVCDTEPIKSMLSTYPVPTNSSINPCTNTNYQGGQYNIMNYGYTLNRFTVGQTERALDQVITYRNSLLRSKGADTGTINNSSINLVSANCTPSANSDINNQNYYGAWYTFFNNIHYYGSGYSPTMQNYYIDHSIKDACLLDSISTELSTTQSYNLGILVSTNIQHVSAYIDFNNDGIFNETNERVVNNQTVSPAATGSYAITIPSYSTGVVLDTFLRMRVITDRNSITGSCNQLAAGKTEDFAVKILRGANDHQTSVGDVTDNNSLKIYPNPVKNEIAFDYEGTNVGEFTAKITNIQGQTINTGNYKYQKGKNHYSISTKGIAAGVYMLQINNKSGVLTHKFVKE